MKNKIFIFLILIFASLNTYEQNISVSGRITEINNAYPIQNHPVFIVSAQTNQIFIHDTIVFTNIEGYYFDTIRDVNYIEETEAIVISTYDCNNILHDTLLNFIPDSTYNLYADFEICDDSIPPQDCHADFYAVLDTTTNTSNFYYFFDTSTGENINSWFWDFGDSTFSFQQNPIHQFNRSGTYNVCLTVVDFNNIATISTDTFCKQITTPNYYNLGGSVFAGDFPINNPSTTHDTAIAYLYRFYNEKDIIPVDTLSFYKLGYYWFQNKIEGNYIVKIGLTPNSLHYNQFFSTYNHDVLIWNNVSPIVLNDSIYDADIHLLPFSDNFSPGIGNIKGYITIKNNNVMNLEDFVSNVEVLLFDSSDTPLISVFSDEFGNFEFKNIEVGNYKLYAELTGKYSLPVVVNVNANNPSVDSVYLEIFYNNPTGINNFDNQEISVCNIFPNPINDNELKIEINLLSHQKLEFGIRNIMGQEISKHNFELTKGKHIISIPANLLLKGIYFLTIKSYDNNIYEVKKFIK